MNYEGFLQIALTKGIGDTTLKRIMHFLQDRDITWSEFCCDNILLKEFFGHKNNVIQAIHAQNEQAKQISERLYDSGIEIVHYWDRQYPERIKMTLGEKSPAFFCYKGNIEILNKKTVGICGSRKVSTRGLGITSDCVRQLTRNGIAVVGGYAAGTDITAHKVALQYSGETVFVLAEGLLRVNIKSEVKGLLNEQNHIFISQYLPESLWNVGNAMKRNRVVISLSDAVILVESGKKGGTFAAGNETLTTRRPLFVIDFAQPEVSAEANSYFISNGGIPIRGRDGVPNLSKVFSAIQAASMQIKNDYAGGEQLKFNLIK